MLIAVAVEMIFLFKLRLPSSIRRSEIRRITFSPDIESMRHILQHRFRVISERNCIEIVLEFGVN